MGTNYSRPLRGYKYSTQVNQDDLSKPYELEHKSFKELFLDDWNLSQNLIFTNLEDGTAVTYGDCIMFSKYISSQINQRDGTKAAVSEIHSGESLVFLVGMLLSNIKCYVLRSEEEVRRIVREGRDNREQVLTTERVREFFRGNRENDYEMQCGTNCGIVVGNRPKTQRELVVLILEWTERFKISRDAVVVANLPYDSPLLYVVLSCCVRCRAQLHVMKDLSRVEQWNPTHIFSEIDAYKTLVADGKKNLEKCGFYRRTEFAIGEKWQQFWIRWGTPSSLFRPHDLIPNLGKDLRYLFVDGDLDRRLHETIMSWYCVPVVNVFMPTEFKNLGASLPCDIRYIKIGTSGSPIVPRITIEGGKIVGRIIDENNQYEYRRNSKSCPTTIAESTYSGEWDEEGALITKA